MTILDKIVATKHREVAAGKERIGEAELMRRLEERKIFVQLTDAAKEALVREGYDPAYGARPLKRVIQRMLQDPLAMKILEGEFPEGSKVTVDARVSGEALEFRRA